MPPVKANPDFNKLKTRTTGSFKRKRNKSKNSWKPFLFFGALVGLATEGILDMNQAEIRKVQASPHIAFAPYSGQMYVMVMVDR